MCPAALLLANVLVVTAGNEGATQDELAKLEGTWLAVGLEEAGHTLPLEATKKEKQEFVFKGVSLTIRRRGKVLAEFMVTVNPSKQPKEMDLHFTQRDDKGKKCLAIYSLEGNQLKICTETKLRPSRGQPRPSLFTTQTMPDQSKRPGVMLFILERQK